MSRFQFDRVEDRILTYAFQRALLEDDAAVIADIAKRINVPLGRNMMLKAVYSHSPDKPRDLNRLIEVEALDDVELLEFCIAYEDLALYQQIFASPDYAMVRHLWDEYDFDLDLVARLMDIADQAILDDIVAGICSEDAQDYLAAALRDLLLPRMPTWPVASLQRILDEAVAAGAWDIAEMCRKHGADTRVLGHSSR